MMPPIPANDEARLAALYEYQILDTAPEAAYDDITRLAAFICGTPIAAVSLIDAKRQWLKSLIGLDAREGSREDAFCAHTILQPDLLVVPDARCDKRFFEHPFVTGEPNIRFYAGATLVTSDGYALGSLCVIDREPRQLTPDQEAALRVLARQVTNQLELARRIRLQDQLMADRAAAEAERRRLAAIVESSADAIISTDMDGKIISWNAGAERVYGYSAPEMVGQPQAALVPAGETSFHAATVQTLLENERIENLEAVRRRKNGERIHVSLTLSLIRDSSGQAVGVSAVGRDITERKRAEEALQAERQFQTALLESLQEGIVACDSEGTLTLFNRAMREFHGRPQLPLPPEQWAEHFDLFQTDGLTPMCTQDIPLFRAFQGEVVRGAEFVIAPQGRPARAVQASGQAIYDGQGKKLGAVVAMHDITARKSIEEVIRESQQFIESVTYNSTSIIFVFDLDTMTNVYSNHNVADFLGYSREQVQSMGSALLPFMLHPDDLPTVESHFGQFADTADGEVVEMEYRARHVSGEWRWIWNRETVFKRHPDGTPRQILGTAHDVTERKHAQEERVRLAAIVESSHDAIVGATLDGTLVSWNAAAEQLYGYTEAEIIGQNASSLTPPAEHGFMAEVTEAILRGERPENREVKRQRKDGTWIDVSLTFSPIRHTTGEITGIATVGRDITLQNQAEEALRRSEEALHTIMGGAPVVLYATDIDGVITLSKGAGLERLGFSPGELVGQSVFEIYRDRPDIADYLRRALAGEIVSYDAQFNDLCYHNEVRPQRDKEGAITGIIGVAHDITERKQAEQTLKDFSVVLEFQMQELERANVELAALATLDGLTGLRNRRSFDERLAEEFERAVRYHKPLSLLLLDVDFFKQYNDAFGHLAGDEVLRTIGRILQKATRETDISARYGGEEIAVILPETDGYGAMQVAERVRMAVATAPWNQREVTVSLGVCTLRLGMERPEEMVSCADRALYQSKADGRNRVTHGGNLSGSHLSMPDASPQG